MNVVCRLMCREELDTFIRGEEIVKGNKGDKRYEEVVGDKLTFTPVKFYDLISMGDITVILKRMKILYSSAITASCDRRGSKVYMVVFEDNGETNFSPFIGEPHRKSFNEPCKELLTYSYSKNDLKPLRIYEINERTSGSSFSLGKTSVEGYQVKSGDIIKVNSYEEAVNDMLHVVYANEQIQQIYDGFSPLARIEGLKEECEEGTAYYSWLNQARNEFYENGGTNNWTFSAFAHCKQKKLTGEQIGEATAKAVSAQPKGALSTIKSLTDNVNVFTTDQYK